MNVGSQMEKAVKNVDALRLVSDGAKNVLELVESSDARVALVGCVVGGVLVAAGVRLGVDAVSRDRAVGPKE